MSPDTVHSSTWCLDTHAFVHKKCEKLNCNKSEQVFNPYVK